VIKETNATTGNITDYLYGDDLIKQTQAANDSYYLYDGLGSTRALSNSAGTITDSYNYESFGEVLNQTGSTENNYLFTGEQFDSNLDNYYLRARYYDQGIGRFTQADKWVGEESNPVTFNKFLYTYSDPVNFIDPSGYFGISDVLSAINVQGTLTTIAGRGGASAAGRKLIWNGGCFIVEELAEAALSNAISGVYVFTDLDLDKPYVGQSIDIERRVKEHLRVPRTTVKGITAVLGVEIAEGVNDKLKDVIDALEQHIIDSYKGPGGNPGQLGGSANKRNQVSRTNKSRKHLVKLINNFKICPK
jgi:RHS repeat-associated protein